MQSHVNAFEERREEGISLHWSGNVLRWERMRSETDNNADRGKIADRNLQISNPLLEIAEQKASSAMITGPSKGE